MNDILSKEEVSTLLDKDEGKANTSSAKDELTPYDFSSKAKNTFVGLDKLEVVNEIYSKKLIEKMGHFLCYKPSIECGNPEQQQYNEFITSLERPTVIATVNVKQLSGLMLICLSNDLISRTVEKLFGGNVNNTATPDRELGKVELRVAKLLLDILLQSYFNAWKIIKDVDYSILKIITNPNLANNFDEQSDVVTNQYNIKIANTDNPFSICIASSTLEPIKGLLTEKVNSGAEDKTWSELLKKNVDNVEVEITSIIANTKISIDELLTLKVGDFISIDNPSNATIYASDIPLYQAKCGLNNGNRAIKIEKILTD